MRSPRLVRHRCNMRIETLYVSMVFADFDSATPRFESWRPSQPVRSLRCDFQVWENRRHSRGLAGNGFLQLAAKSGNARARFTCASCGHGMKLVRRSRVGDLSNAENHLRRILRSSDLVTG